MNVTTVSELNILSASLGVPFSASIELTTMCNFRCEHCYIPSHSQELSYSQVIRFLDELKEMGVFEITDDGIALTELNENFTFEEVQEATGAPVINKL